MTFMNLKFFKVFLLTKCPKNVKRSRSDYAISWDRYRNMSCSMRPSIMFHFDTTIPFDPINLKIVRRLNFTQKIKAKKSENLWTRGGQISSFIVFSSDLSGQRQRRRHADSYLRILLSCFKSSWTSSKHDAINMMCLFMFLAWRSFGSLEFCGACDFTSVRSSLQTSTILWCFRFTCPTKRNSLGSFRSRACKFLYLELFSF